MRRDGRDKDASHTPGARRGSTAEPALGLGKRTLAEALVFDEPHVAAATATARPVGSGTPAVATIGEPPQPVQLSARGLPFLQLRGIAANIDAGRDDSAAIREAAQRGTSGAAVTLPHADAIQRSFGAHDVSHVKAHTDDAAHEGATAMGAQAFASGDHVAFAGTPDLHTAAHEAAHVVQQRGGVQLKGGVGEVGDRYEQRADQVADAVVRGERAEGLLDEHAKQGVVTPSVQRHLVQRRDQNGLYAGNRPDPSAPNSSGYTMHGSASRVMTVNDTVTYEIEQSVSVAGRLSVRWEVINDPGAVSTGVVAATLVGPIDQMRWRLVARAPASIPSRHGSASMSRLLLS